MTPPSANLSIDFITVVVTVDHAIPRRPLALLAPPPPIDSLYRSRID
jgi:hypothetical protein